MCAKHSATILHSKSSKLPFELVSLITEFMDIRSIHHSMIISRTFWYEYVSKHRLNWFNKHFGSVFPGFHDNIIHNKIPKLYLDAYQIPAWPHTNTITNIQDFSIHALETQVLQVRNQYHLLAEITRVPFKITYPNGFHPQVVSLLIEHKSEIFVQNGQCPNCAGHITKCKSIDCMQAICLFHYKLQRGLEIALPRGDLVC